MHMHNWDSRSSFFIHFLTGLQLYLKENVKGKDNVGDRYICKGNIKMNLRCRASEVVDCI